MNYPVNNFRTKWYIPDGGDFGANRTTYFHEGCDINLGTGGDSDLGQPLLAVADGVISSVHSHTTSPTFGNHIHLEFKIGDKTYWAHYAHCQDIYVKLGETVKHGDTIATVGKSGTKYAHVHFAIKNQPTGVDGIAKIQEDLKKWEDPIRFIEANMGNAIMALNMSQFTEEVFNKSKEILPDYSYNFSDQLDKTKFKDELVVVKFNSLDEERRWRSDRIKEINSLTDNYKTLMETAQKQLSEIARLNNQLKSDIGGIFAPTNQNEVEIPHTDNKAVLMTIGDVIMGIINKIWKR